MAKSEKYVATRKDIFAGQLLKIKRVPVEIVRDNNDNFNEITESNEETLMTDPYYSDQSICRDIMLFNINKDGLSNDLIYTTPTNYTVRGIKPKIDVNNNDIYFNIENYVKLEEWIEDQGYGIDLTQHDLNQLFKKYIALQKRIKLRLLKKVYHQEPKAFFDISYDISNLISIYKMGSPHPEEPNYGLIKKRR